VAVRKTRLVAWVAGGGGGVEGSRLRYTRQQGRPVMSCPLSQPVRDMVNEVLTLSYLWTPNSHVQRQVPKRERHRWEVPHRQCIDTNTYRSLVS